MQDIRWLDGETIQSREDGNRYRVEVSLNKVELEPVTNGTEKTMSHDEFMSKIDNREYRQV